MLIWRIVLAGIVVSGCHDRGITLADHLADLGAVPCAVDGSFACFTLTQPLDHADAAHGTIDLAYAIRPASGPSKGMIVTLYGGPGFSGLAFLDDFATVDPELPNEFDLAYFDLRGVGGPGSLDCPLAAEAFYHPGLRAGVPVEDAAVAARADAFGSACTTEIKVAAADLAFYTTAQAAADLEAFRAELEFPTLTLYGLSYGTQLAQTYATAHPTHVRAIVLDGVVDLSRPNVEFASELARATNGVLDRVLAACADDPMCAADFPAGPRVAFDALVNQLATAARTLAFPVTGGARPQRTFTIADLDTTATLSMDHAEVRTAFLHALSAFARRDDLVPMLSLYYDTSGLDPDTTLPMADPTYSDAVYYSITCNDYGHPPGGSVAERQKPWLDAGHTLRADPMLRLFSPYFGDLPCATWPSAPPAPPLPAAFEPPAPTLLINADADTATAFVQGNRMFDGLVASAAHASVIEVHNGHHVMLGTGEPCVDQAAAAFLRDPEGSIPGHKTLCDSRLIDTYVQRLAPPPSRIVTSSRRAR